MLLPSASPGHKALCEGGAAFPLRWSLALELLGNTDLEHHLPVYSNSGQRRQETSSAPLPALSPVTANNGLPLVFLPGNPGREKTGRRRGTPETPILMS